MTSTTSSRACIGDVVRLNRHHYVIVLVTGELRNLEPGEIVLVLTVGRISFQVHAPDLGLCQILLDVPPGDWYTLIE